MEKRPDFWVGRISLDTTDLQGSNKFLADIGLRHELETEDMLIKELRGGTHLIMFKKDQLQEQEAYFNLMAEDVDAAYEKLRGLGYEVSEMQRGKIHDMFTVTEPGGNKIRINSSHVRDHSLV